MNDCEYFNDEKVRILMATYNGEFFLSKQIQSLIDQTYENWQLIIRDDGSSDQTLRIIEEFQKSDERISILDDSFGNLGSCQNFSKLMEIPSDSRYIMFCDQDDVWMKDKIERSVKTMKILEREFGRDEKLMVYGTYTMINENGVKLPLAAPDYSTKPNLKLLLSQNYIYGCTMLINKNLLTNSIPVPLTAENHDYWLVLSALASNAHFAYIEEPLLFYRQHSANVSGSFKNAHFTSRLRRIFSELEVHSIYKRLTMFFSLKSRFESDISTDNRALLDGFLNKVSEGGINASIYCFKNGIRRIGKLQTALYYINMLRTTKSI